ncbi:MAG TPA: hypothetical protein VF662_02085 [Allosphingosinicella sp.]
MTGGRVPALPFVSARARLEAIIAFSIMLAACDGGKDAAPVDTTIAEPAPAQLSGELSYPSDYLPQDLRVCAELLSSGALSCNARFHDSKGKRTYRLEVPAGRYHVYATTSEMPGYKAYYTEAVLCGLSVECTSHLPVPLELRPGQVRNGIDPGDWYNLD